jgi:hypothetical protein
LPHLLIKQKRLSSLLMKNCAKTITKPQSGTHKIPTHTSPKRTLSTLHTCVIVISSPLRSNNSNPQTQSKWFQLRHRQLSNQPTLQRQRPCRDIWRSAPELSATRHRSSDSDEEPQRRARQGWRHRISPNIPSVASHRTPLGPRHRSFDFTTTNKPRQTQGHAGEDPNTTTKSMSPTLLVPTIVATKALARTPRPSIGPACRCPAPKMKPPRGKMTLRRRHRPITKIKFFPWRCTITYLCVRGAAAMQRCLQEGQRRPQPPPSQVAVQNWDKVFTLACSTPSTAQGPAPTPERPPSNLPAEEEAPTSAAVNRTSQRPHRSPCRTASAKKKIQCTRHHADRWHMECIFSKNMECMKIKFIQYVQNCKLENEIKKKPAGLGPAHVSWGVRGGSLFSATGGE